jgi:hypothetical protein
MIMVLENAFHGQPRYALHSNLIELLACVENARSDMMLQPCRTRLDACRLSFLPCAVTMHCLSSYFATKIVAHSNLIGCGLSVTIKPQFLRLRGRGGLHELEVVIQPGQGVEFTKEKE